MAAGLPPSAPLYAGVATTKALPLAILPAILACDRAETNGKGAKPCRNDYILSVFLLCLTLAACDRGDDGPLAVAEKLFQKLEKHGFSKIADLSAEAHPESPRFF